MTAMVGKTLQASASAPVLLRENGGHAHSQRVEKKVPPLALVPLDLLEEQRRRAEVERSEEQRRGKRRTNGSRPRKYSQNGAKDQEKGAGRHEEEKKRLGERFLGMMALLASLRRMDLEEVGSPHKSQRNGRRSQERPLSVSPEKPSSLELFVEKKKMEQREKGKGGADRSTIERSPHRKPEPVVNVATAPLREHLTFDISMLLPPPIDTRQSTLHSPILRKKRKKRLKKRRRQRRPTGATIVDGKRTWQTSHVTWVPHASADYAQARADQQVAARANSKLVAKFAALKRVSAPVGGSCEKRYLYADPREERRRKQAPMEDVRDERPHQQCIEQSEHLEQEHCESEGGGCQEQDAENDPVEPSSEDEPRNSDSSEQDEDEEDDDEQEAKDDDEVADQVVVAALPDRLPPRRSLPSSRTGPLPSSVLVRPMQTHQPAWISPELRAWLLQTGLFRTNATA